MLKQCIISSMEIDDRWGEKYRFYLAFFFTIYIFLTTPQALSQALADHAMLSVFLWFIHAVFCQLHNLSRRLPHDAYHSTHTKKVERASLDTKAEQENTIDPVSFFSPFVNPSAIWSDACSACHDKYTKSHQIDIWYASQTSTHIQILLTPDDLETDQAVGQFERLPLS